VRAADAVPIPRKQPERHGVTVLDHGPSREHLANDGVIAGAVVLVMGWTSLGSGMAGL